MPDQRSFTGVRRKRQTKWSVAAGDRLAKGLITIGGVGTIIAVLLVCAYLVSVVVPLFMPAKVTPAERLAGVLDQGPKPTAVGVDEFGMIGWALYPDGHVRAFRMDNGKTLADLSPAKSGLAGMTAASFAVDGQTATFGFSDGKLRSGRIGFATTFLEPKHVPDAVREMKPGAVAEIDQGMVARIPTGQFRRQQLKIELDDPLESGATEAIVLIDRVAAPSGDVFCFSTSAGKLHVAAPPPKSGLSLGNDDAVKLVGADLPLPSTVTSPPKFLVLSGLGDFVYAAWEDGRLLRFEVRDVEKPRLVEEIRLFAEPNATLTSFVPLLGGYTVVAGDSLGRVKTWFPVVAAVGKDSAGADARKMVNAQTFEAEGNPVTAIVSSGSAREIAVGYRSGRVRLLFITSQNTIVDEATSDGKPIDALRIGPKGNRIVAATAGGVTTWTFDEGHPDGTLAAIFLPVWYEGEPGPKHVWQTSGGEGSEPKLGLTPLIFGTLKATFYSMLFGAPLALLAALYTSEFLHPNTRARVKPTIELMASLPSVVLGFLAGLVIAPIFSRIVPAALGALVTVPLALLLGAYLWQLVPVNLSIRMVRYRFGTMLLLAIPLGLFAAGVAGPWVEQLMFDGDIKAWLTHQRGSAVPGWMLLLLPLGAIGVSLFMTRVINPWLRSFSGSWSRGRCALIELLKFLIGIVLTVLVVWGAALALDALRFDPRGSLIGQYDQTNALIVGFAMGFAIIPLIYTIADDALAAVPAHLRSASLGAGATPWQTAVRIVIPTAMSGLFSAVMIGLGRAVGETMIVLMAAGGESIMDVNPFNGFQTLSAGIATQLPEAAVGSTHARVLFLAALTLFLITFVINTGAEMIRQRFRRRAYEL